MSQSILIKINLFYSLALTAQIESKTINQHDHLHERFCPFDYVDPIKPAESSFNYSMYQGKVQPGLDLAIFLDKLCEHRIKSTGYDVKKFVLNIIRLVDLRFNEPAMQKIYHGRINFRITYFEIVNETFGSEGYPELSANALLNKVSNYAVSRRDSLANISWDHPIFFTGLNTYSSRASSNPKRRIDVLGVAYPGRLCTRASLIELNDFDRSWVLLHELGHSFGAHHDLQSSKDCDETYSLMSSRVGTEKIQWTKCNLKDFVNARDHIGKCLYQEKRTTRVFKGMELPTNFPGENYSLDDQCKFGMSSNAYSYRSVPCYQKICRLKWLEWQGLAHILGTPCGNGLICCIGKCLSRQQCSKLIGAN